MKFVGKYHTFTLKLYFVILEHLLFPYYMFSLQIYFSFKDKLSIRSFATTPDLQTISKYVAGLPQGYCWSCRVQASEADLSCMLSRSHTLAPERFVKVESLRTKLRDLLVECENTKKQTDEGVVSKFCRHWNVFISFFLLPRKFITTWHFSGPAGVLFALWILWEWLGNTFRVLAVLKNTS